MEFRVKFGLTIREARDALNLTQAELADEIGVSSRTVQNWEAGKVPRPKQRRALLAFFEGMEIAA
jgi:DNA-binding transcriptional regulator YiaG